MTKKKQDEGAKELTARQWAFVMEYLKDLNGTKAAIRAGYSPKTATQQATRLLTKAHVMDAIAEKKDEREKLTGIDAAWVLRRLAEEAEADVADLYAEDGSLLPVRDWPLIWRKGLVQGVEHIEVKEPLTGKPTGETIVKLRLSDRIKRVELIGKHVSVQAFRDQVQHSGGISLSVSKDDAEL